jgi:hypothetical protein
MAKNVVLRGSQPITSEQVWAALPAIGSVADALAAINPERATELLTAPPIVAAIIQRAIAKAEAAGLALGLLLRRDPAVTLRLNKRGIVLPPIQRELLGHTLGIGVEDDSYEIGDHEALVLFACYGRRRSDQLEGRGANFAEGALPVLTGSLNAADVAASTQVLSSNPDGLQWQRRGRSGPLLLSCRMTEDKSRFLIDSEELGGRGVRNHGITPHAWVVYDEIAMARRSWYSDQKSAQEKAARDHKEQEKAADAAWFYGFDPTASQGKLRGGKTAILLNESLYFDGQYSKRKLKLKQFVEEGYRLTRRSVRKGSGDKVYKDMLMLGNADSFYWSGSGQVLLESLEPFVQYLQDLVDSGRRIPERTPTPAPQPLQIEPWPGVWLA